MRLIVAAMVLTTGNAGAMVLTTGNAGAMVLTTGNPGAMVLTTGSAFVPSTAQLAARRRPPTPRARPPVAKMVDIEWFGGRGRVASLFDFDGSYQEEQERLSKVCSHPLRPEPLCYRTLDLCGRPLRCTAFPSPPCGPSPVAPSPPCNSPTAIASLQ